MTKSIGNEFNREGAAVNKQLVAYLLQVMNHYWTKVKLLKVRGHFSGSNKHVGNTKSKFSNHPNRMSICREAPLSFALRSRGSFSGSKAGSFISIKDMINSLATFEAITSVGGFLSYEALCFRWLQSGGNHLSQRIIMPNPSAVG